MVEGYLRQGVLDHRHLDARVVDDIGDAGVTLGERRFLGKIDLRGEPTKKFRDAVAGVLGVAPPTAPNTTAGDGARTVSESSLDGVAETCTVSSTPESDEMEESIQITNTGDRGRNRSSFRFEHEDSHTPREYQSFAPPTGLRIDVSEPGTCPALSFRIPHGISSRQENSQLPVCFRSWNRVPTTRIKPSSSAGSEVARFELMGFHNFKKRQRRVLQPYFSRRRRAASTSFFSFA
ncbi:MAG: hypothetical protein IH986_19255 [Planctomycetes bacterium]|nr:hypothetical protein [Planctomycetota bacterium]